MENIDPENAKAHMDELVARVEAGVSIDITRDGKPVARLTAPAKPRKPIDAAALAAGTIYVDVRRQFMKDLGAKAAVKALPGPDAARSGDFLYDDDGMPA